MGSVECRPGQGVPWGLGMGIPIQTTQSILLQPSDPQAQLPNSPMASKQTNPPHPKAATQGVGLGQEWSHSLGDKEISLPLLFPTVGRGRQEAPGGENLTFEMGLRAHAGQPKRPS